MQFISDSWFKNKISQMSVNPSRGILELEDACSQPESSQVQPNPAELNKPRTDLQPPFSQPIESILL